MRARTLNCLTALIIVIGITRAPAEAGEARLLHYPSIHKDFVVFVHAGEARRAADRSRRAGQCSAISSSVTTVPSWRTTLRETLPSWYS